MSDHIQISIKQTGDLVTAITATLNIAKSIKQDLCLELQCGTSLTVSSLSHSQDLIQIALKEIEIKKLKHQIGKQ